MSGIDCPEEPPLELRRRLGEATARIVALEKQQAELREIVSRTEEDARALGREAEAARREHDALMRELEHDRRRAAEVETQIANVEQANDALARRLSELRRGADRTALGSRALELELESTRQRVGLATRTLAEVVQTVVRLSYQVERSTEHHGRLARR